jgi:hypothetical protein
MESRIKDILSPQQIHKNSQNSRSFHDKSSEETRNGWNILQYNKGYSQHPTKQRKQIISSVQNETRVSIHPTHIQNGYSI